MASGGLLWRRLAAWALAAAVLAAWFLLSAYVLYSHVPQDAVRSALEELSSVARGQGLLGKAASIFANNLKVLAVFAVPVVGQAVGLVVLTYTAAVGRYAAELLARLLGGSWEGYFYHYIVATPFFPLELLAYGVAAAESLLFLRHRCLRCFAAGLAVAVAVLAVAAVVEAYVMRLYGL